MIILLLLIIIILITIIIRIILLRIVPIVCTLYIISHYITLYYSIHKRGISLLCGGAERPRGAGSSRRARTWRRPAQPGRARSAPRIARGLCDEEVQLSMLSCVAFVCGGGVRPAVPTPGEHGTRKLLVLVLDGENHPTICTESCRSTPRLEASRHHKCRDAE